MSVPHQRSMEKAEAISFNSFSPKAVCWRILRESPVLTKGFSHRERGEEHSLQKWTLFLEIPKGKISPREEDFSSGVHNLVVIQSFQNPDVIEDISFSRGFIFNLHT